MPLPSHHKSTSTSSIGNSNKISFSTTSGLLGAAQALGSVGAPAANLHNSAINTLQPSPASLQRGPAQGRTHIRSISGYETAFLPEPSVLSNAPPFNSTRSSVSTQVQEELQLHLGTSNKGIEQQNHSSNILGNTRTSHPQINIDRASPTRQSRSNEQLPGVLQSGSGRPRPPSLERVPTIPSVALEMSQDSYGIPLRPSATHSHSFPASNPTGGYDGQNFSPFAASSSDAGRLVSPSQKYLPSDSRRNVPSSPLGLADIRPRTDSTITDILPGANPYSYDGNTVQPTTSNYLAPWALYAFDWCKWPVQSDDAGKVAVGSYLEDGHNFVCAVKMEIGK